MRAWWMNAMLALVVVARCATGQEFNDAVAEGIINELSLELRGPWMLLDYDAALIESGLALTDNYSTIDFDLVRGLLFSGMRAARPSVYMHYVASERGGYSGVYNNNSVSLPYYVADMSLSNETCSALNFTAATADDEYRALAQEVGVSAGGYCIKGIYIDQVTGEVLSSHPATGETSWYQAMRFDPRLRPWYIDTAAAGRRNWNSIFAYVTPPHPLVVGIGRPLYAPLTNELLGVAALDFELDSLELILRTALADSAALAFILEENTTLLVAASVSNVAVKRNNVTGIPSQRDALDCGHALIERAAAFVDTVVGVDDDSVRTFEGRYWLRKLVLTDEYGLVWRVVNVQDVACNSGYENDGSACVACPSGERGAGGTAECESCASGYIAPDPKTAMCAPCPPGTYANEDATACLGCPGRRTSREGASTCDMCKEGFFQDLDVLPWPILTDVDNDCIKCVRGMTCAASQFDGVGLHTSEVVVEKGYWRLTQTTRRIRVCPGGRKACVGGNAVGDELCAPGHSGPLCTVW